LPVIANPVGVHQSMVIPGTNGFLPRNTAEWLDAVEALRDRGLRKRMGDASRRIVEADYSLAAAGRAWGQLFETLARRRAC
jgi:glycosyltransferase involved in cell wall biosynthesis